MSPMGQQRPSHPAPVLNNVRFAPKATVSRQNAIRRYVPIATNAPQQKASLFDYLIGARKQRTRDGEAECLGGFEVDHELELGRLFNRQITRLCTF
jgi:hypothetical protein